MKLEGTMKLEDTMKKILAVLFILSMGISSAFAQIWEPNIDDTMELAVAAAIIDAQERDSGLTEWFDSAYAYAVFPRVGKGAIGIGGAHGKGIVIRNNETIGETSLTQITLGFQLGGQIYSEFIMFKDSAAFGNFSRGNFEMGAQVSAVALTLGASADANYDKGVAVFTVSVGGLMYEASIGGQKFSYEHKR